jgi:NAD(P)-dependent dehydrogenase (short-subunit alcohol dehydrogenase family)
MPWPRWGSCTKGRDTVSSSLLLGQVALEGYALYSSAKAALDRFLEGYRLGVEDRSCLALVYPLAVRTDFFRAAGDAPLPWPSQSADSMARALYVGWNGTKRPSTPRLSCP